MVVLYWSWLRSVCSISRPGGTGTHSSGFDARSWPCPVLVGNSRESRGRVGQLEAVGLADLACCSRRSPGTTAAIASRIGVVVVVEPLPRHRVVGAEQRPGELADDRHLAAHLVARRLQAATRQMHHRHRVLDGDHAVRRRPGCRGRCGPATAGSAPSRPCTTWLRLSFVDTCTVSAQRRNAASVTAVSGVADAKLPPMPMNTFARPSRIARIASTVSTPCSRGLTMPNRSSSAARNSSGIFSQMPIVRSPWTLECPRTGHRPAPGLPIIPRIKQHVGDLGDRRHGVAVLGQAHRPARDRALRCGEHRLPTRSSWARSMPVASNTVSRSICRVRASYSAKFEQCASTKSRSTTVPGARSSASRSSRPRPGEQRHVAAEADLHELVGDRDARGRPRRAPSADP